ncbi:MAG: alpha/beta hydrolase [Aestuariivirga sp.]|nr:alpha/beta hydrolase [Aestuariivirga sp.]
MTSASGYAPVHFQTDDGLRLFARDYSSSLSALTPLLCLPGLTRNSKDFEPIAPWLAQTRRVIAPDFRGRGLSHYASDPASYRPDIELIDAIAFLDFLKIDRVAVIGTSRGGIVGMLIAAFFNDRLGGLFLNDVGAELDSAGLLRIRSYLGVQSEFTSWEMAVANLKSSNCGFESLTADEWRAFAQRVFKPVNGVPRIDYDPALLRTFPSVEDITAGRGANLWEFFGKIGNLPVSLARGEHSDLLSAATVAAMKQQNAGLDATTIPKRGHAPFLDEAPAKEALMRWLARVDAKEKGR